MEAAEFVLPEVQKRSLPSGWELTLISNAVCSSLRSTDCICQLKRGALLSTQMGLGRFSVWRWEIVGWQKAGKPHRSRTVRRQECLCIEQIYGLNPIFEPAKKSSHVHYRCPFGSQHECNGVEP